MSIQKTEKPHFRTSTTAYMLDHSPQLKSMVSEILYQKTCTSPAKKVLMAVGNSTWGAREVQKAVVSDPEFLKYSISEHAENENLIEVAAYYLLWLSLQVGKTWSNPTQAWTEFVVEQNFQFSFTRVSLCCEGKRERKLFIDKLFPIGKLLFPCKRCNGRGSYEKKHVISLALLHPSETEDFNAQ